MELTPEREHNTERKSLRKLLLFVIALLLLSGIVAIAYFLTRPKPPTISQYVDPTQPLTVPKPSSGITTTATPSSPSSFNPSAISQAKYPPAASPTPTPDPEAGIRQELLAAAQSKITYEQLKKNADRYDGESWAFTGRVFQIQENGSQTFALVSLDAWGNKLIAVKANFATDFVEKDQVYVVGILAGNYSYTSVAGWNMTIPAIDAHAILKPSDAARIKSGKGTSK